MKNIFYFSAINKIGGIESFFYYLAKKYKDWDITIFYRTGDKKQIERLSQYVRVVKWDGQTRVKCDKAFFNYTIDMLPYVDAKEYIQIVHADYKSMKVKPQVHPKITRYIGVSQLACDRFKELTGKDTELAYTPTPIDKPKKVLHLISATRLTHEKGAQRMKQLSVALEQAGIPYTWTVFTDSETKFSGKNFVMREPRLDIIDYIADSDYLVQLSDSEGLCLSVIEALECGTPVIVTPCPVFKEIGVQDRVNGFILPFDMRNIPIREIYEGLPKFEFKTLPDRWAEILAEGKGVYQDELKNMVLIKITQSYFDLALERKVKKKEEIRVAPKRAKELVEKGFAVYI
ncbi:MAG: glycosyltransferase [Bacteroidaceae bacterium]|nr:glycosyltransferase [Bacteroidaceae bacterium]